MFLKRLFFFAAFFGMLCESAMPASGDFQIAAQLLRAARSGDIPMVERLVNSGANVNFVDSTGLSIVCTAIMNNDFKAAQLLQVYGADASRCDIQIRQYRNRQPRESSGGLFSGLSNAQNMTLAVGGAALVIGGIYLIGDSLFGTGGNRNSGGGGPGGQGPGGGGGGGTNPGTPTEQVDIKHSVLHCNWTNNQCAVIADDGTAATAFNLPSRMNAYSNTRPEPELLTDWEFMQNAGNPMQNYLLLMGGYAAWARGYTGQVAPRDWLGGSNNPFAQDVQMKPMTVALVTANGVNPVETAANKDISYAINIAATPDLGQERRYKNIDANGDEITNLLYDFSGMGSVFNEDASPWFDTLLAQMIVGGRVGDDYNQGDFLGFMPDGQIALYRTGGGKKYDFVLDIDPDEIDTNGDVEIEIEGSPYIVTAAELGEKRFSTGGKEYIITGNMKVYEATPQSYRNFEAMNDAFSKTLVVVGSTPKAKYGVIANAAVPHNMKSVDVAEVKDIDAYAKKHVPTLQTDPDYISPLHEDYLKKALDLFVRRYYYYAGNAGLSTESSFVLFSKWDSRDANLPFIIFSAGEYDRNASYGTLTATMDNAAPLLYAGLNRHFMTAVAVWLTGGTSNITSAAGEPNFSNNVKYQLSNYSIGDESFGARACGVAGIGKSGVDPWCFASIGITGEHAVATLAGAVGLVQSAFFYMTNEQIFTLLALTADGKVHSQAVLERMYQIPEDLLYELPDKSTDATAYEKKWMELFAKTFGYGVVNLKRATTPGKVLSYYGGKSTTTAKWTTRASVISKGISLSSPYGDAVQETISAPLFDASIVDADGKVFPRVFNMEFEVGGKSYGANLSNMLGEISFDDEDKNENVTFQLTDDGRNVKNLSVGFSSGGIEAKAAYKQNAARMFSNDNPIMSLTGETFSATAGFGPLGFTVFGGNMTVDGLLETDPALSGGFRAALIGGVRGFDTSAKLGPLKLGGGYMEEDNTTLGAYSDGLFSFGGGKTTYVSGALKLWKLTATYTAARTTTNPGIGFISDMSDLYSDSYGVGADFGKWSFNISRPLAITKGTLSYAHTAYEPLDDGYDFMIDTTIRDIDLAPPVRETRFSMLYRPEVSERTNLAFGAALRVNPDNTRGIENILLMKFKHIW